VKKLVTFDFAFRIWLDPSDTTEEMATLMEDEGRWDSYSTLILDAEAMLIPGSEFTRQQENSQCYLPFVRQDLTQD